MTEPLDPNGGHSEAAAPKCKAPLWRRVRAWTLLLVICAVPVGLAIGGGFWMRSALRPGRPWEDTLYYLLGSIALFVPLAAVVRVYVRSKWKTGRWIPPREESLKKISQCSTGGCAARQNSWIIFAIKWGSYSAMNRSLPPWQRIAGWMVLAVYAASLLALTAFGVICFGAAFADDNTITASLLFIGLGLAVLIVPALAVRSLIRGIRAGKVGGTREDLEQMRGQRTLWREREWQRPLRSKILTTAVLIALYSLWWMRVALHHALHPHESWMTPTMYTPAFIYAIWAQFRRPKTSQPQNSGTSAPTEI